jgi:two-component system sensor histidine kinase DctS
MVNGLRMRAQALERQCKASATGLQARRRALVAGSMPLCYGEAMPQHSHATLAPHAAVLDFALLQRQHARSLPRAAPHPVVDAGPAAVLVVASVVALVLYLNAFRDAEEERRRGADGQWLEQSVQFHFPPPGGRPAGARPPGRPRPGAGFARRGQGAGRARGLLWRAPAWCWQAWIGPRAPAAATCSWQEDQALHADNYQPCRRCRTLPVGLRRSSYAGPMRRTDGSHRPRVAGRAVFRARRLVGNYVARCPCRPAWRAGARVVPAEPPGAPGRRRRAPRLRSRRTVPASHLAVMNLPGTDLFMEVAPLHAQPPVPRCLLRRGAAVSAGHAGQSGWPCGATLPSASVQARLQAQVVLRTAMEALGHHRHARLGARWQDSVRQRGLLPHGGLQRRRAGGPQRPHALLARQPGRRNRRPAPPT